MTSQGTAQGRFQRAIQRRHLFAAEMVLREMDHVTLANALALTLLTAEASPERYDRAAARWHMRFVQEARSMTLPDSQLALAALVALRDPDADVAAATLGRLATAYGVNGVESVLNAYRAQ